MLEFVNIIVYSIIILYRNRSLSPVLIVDGEVVVAAEVVTNSTYIWQDLLDKPPFEVSYHLIALHKRTTVQAYFALVIS